MSAYLPYWRVPATGLWHSGEVADRSVNDILEETWARITTVAVVRGSTFDTKHRAANEVLVTVRDRAAIDRLRVALRAESSDAAIMTPGDPTIALLSERDLLASIQLVDGYVRCPELWEGDARLDDPTAPTDWLASVGDAP